MELQVQGRDVLTQRRRPLVHEPRPACMERFDVGYASALVTAVVRQVALRSVGFAQVVAEHGEERRCPVARVHRRGVRHRPFEREDDVQRLAHLGVPTLRASLSAVELPRERLRDGREQASLVQVEQAASWRGSLADGSAQL